MSLCYQCPRMCGVDRSRTLGRCHAPDRLLVSRLARHVWEEPVLGGSRGVAAVFFGGCGLGCVFCQNRAIRDGAVGDIMTPGALVDGILQLVDEGAAAIDLVTPTHYTEALLPVLADLRARTRVPIIWNSSGYERPESLRRLSGLVDIYLPDFKYASAEAALCSDAPDYPEAAVAAIAEMVRQRGCVCFEGEQMVSGVLVRHLVLPGGRRDSMAVLEALAALCPPDHLRLSLMSQYTPDFVDADAAARFPHLSRRLTTFEYRSVLEHARALGFEGFCQHRSSATADYTPNF